jgi:hypothetical protein
MAATDFQDYLLTHPKYSIDEEMVAVDAWVAAWKVAEEKFNSALRQPTKQGSGPSEICHCDKTEQWLNYRLYTNLQGFYFCPSCGKLLPC